MQSKLKIGFCNFVVVYVKAAGSNDHKHFMTFNSQCFFFQNSFVFQQAAAGGQDQQAREKLCGQTKDAIIEKKYYSSFFLFVFETTIERLDVGEDTFPIGTWHGNHVVHV